MSDTHGHPGAPSPDAHVPDEHGSSHEVAGPHGSTADHGEGHGHDDHAHGGHGHLAEPLGPIDWPMWGAGALGVAAGAVVAACFAVTTGLVALA
jgi:hypothetical protein